MRNSLHVSIVGNIEVDSMLSAVHLRYCGLTSIEEIHYVSQSTGDAQNLTVLAHS